MYVGTEDAIYNTGVKIGTGSETDVIKCYSPVTGQHLVVKTFNEKEIEAIVLVYKELKDANHCVSIYNRFKNKVFEPLYDTDLEQMLEKRQLHATKDKLRAIFQIASGVGEIHSVIYNKGQPKVSLSHKDLKPKNIFVKKDANNQYKFVVGDYESILRYNEVHGTLLYFSPEKAQFFKKDSTEGEVIQFNIGNGLQSDIWQLGLIISSILQNVNFPFDWQKGTAESVITSNIANLDQDYIQKHIDGYINEIEHKSIPDNEKKAFKKAWRMVGKYMLQVQTEKRRDIDYIQKKIKKVQKIYDGSTK